MSQLPKVWIKAGREKKIRTHYPWVQKEEVVRAEEILPGSVAQLYTQSGEFLATGIANPKTRFPFRVLSLQDEPINTDFFVRKFQEAKNLRIQAMQLGPERNYGVRWVFAEADSLSGLIVDEYAGVLVVQVRNAGMARLKEVWLPALIQVFEPIAIYEKSEMESRREEGLAPEQGVLYGEMPETVEIIEDGCKFQIPVVDGLKTGYYLDQLETRRALAASVKPGDTVLDTFCYVGAFSVTAAKAGAVTTGVDIAEVAIDQAKKNASLNGVECDFVLENAFDYLETTDKTFDWIILDPPAIAKQREKRDSLKWAVWKLVHRAIDRLNPGGQMIVCSCSYQMNLQMLQETIRFAAADKGKVAIMDRITVQSADHPISLAFPESWYLKCVWTRLV